MHNLAKNAQQPEMPEQSQKPGTHSPAQFRRAGIEASQGKKQGIPKATAQRKLCARKRRKDTKYKNKNKTKSKKAVDEVTGYSGVGRAKQRVGVVGVVTGAGNWSQRNLYERNLSEH